MSREKMKSDEILQSLFEDIRAVGPICDIAEAIKSEKKKKDKHNKDNKRDKKLKSKDDADTKKKVRRKKDRKSKSPHSRRSRSPIQSKSYGHRSGVSPVAKRSSRRTPPFYRDQWKRFRWGDKVKDSNGHYPWDRDRWSRSRSRSWSPTRYKRSTRYLSPKPREPDENRIDRKELLALAKKSCAFLSGSGKLPKGSELRIMLRNKSVKELIQFCEDIRTRDFEAPAPENFVFSKNDDDEENAFKTLPVRSIHIKIKEGAEINPKTNLERFIEENALRKHFPVSSGENHKNNRMEWVPVEKPETTNVSVVDTLSKRAIRIPVAYKLGMSALDAALARARMCVEGFNIPTATTQVPPQIPLLAPPPSPPVFPSLPQPPSNSQIAYNGQESNPAHHNSAYVDSVRPSNTIWATKDTLRNAREFSGGVGEMLLSRMGWQKGRGLGRNEDGQKEPLILDVKVDRKGLVSMKDKPASRKEKAAKIIETGKNPVSLIMEYCAKNGFPPPLFDAIEEGPPNRRNFGCKAVLNGVQYDAASASTNKKAAKARVCLIMCQALGLQ